MIKDNYKISGMTCANCKIVITKKVSEVPGVNKAKVNLALNYLKVETEDEVTSKQIIKAVQDAGYKAEKLEETNFEPKISKEFLWLIIRFIISTLLTMPMWIGMVLMLVKNHSEFAMFLHNPIFQLSLTLVIEFVIGWRFFVDVFFGIKNKKLNMAFLVVVGTLSAIGLSIYNASMDNWQSNMHTQHLYFETAATIITLVLLGKILEGVAKNKTTNSIKSLTKLLPNTAIKIIDGKEVVVDLKEVKVGDILIVKPGATIPLDGIVVEGTSHVNESMLTGESKPVKKKTGDPLTGATVNSEGVLKIEVTKIGANTTISKIIDLVKDAQSSEIEIQKTVDKISAWFIPIIFLLAIITFTGWSLYHMSFNEEAFVNMIAVLVIACPCALGLATPTAIMVGTGRAAQAGILFKGGNLIEKLSQVKTMIFDKTGTLTKGKMEVQEFEILEQEQEKELVFNLIKNLENQSDHPIANAVKNWNHSDFNFKAMKVSDFKTVVSFGLEGLVENYKVRIGKPNWFSAQTLVTEKIQLLEKQGQTVFLVEVNEKLVAYISVADTIKENASTLIKELNDLNINTVLLTGDAKLTADYIGNSLGIKTIFSETLISQKAEVVKSFQKENQIVAMIGDGINDSVALAQADVGLSMNDSSGIAIDSSDVVLMKEDLLEVLKAIKVAKKTLRKIKSNLFWAFIYNVVAIPLAMFGIFMPEIAALAMALSSVSVVVNSLFLRIK